MSDEMIELAKRAVACVPLSQWPPGIRSRRQSDGMAHRVSATTVGLLNFDWLPDLTDPATIGCLLHLVREACTPEKFHEAVGFCYGNYVRGQRSMMDDRGVVVEYLVAALEAADE